MKRTFMAVLILSFLVISSGLVFAARPAKQTITVNKTVDPEAAITAKKAELNGTEWTVEVKPMSAKAKGKAETDVISFTENQVVSKNLQQLGYAPSNYSVRFQDDGTATWETMQVSEKDGTAFWRGDIQDGAMRGILSKQGKRGNQDFAFASVSVTNTAKPVVTQ